ncbi:hypothetical protein J2858_003391 [Neorhizobium galegae]|uniref:hypothetical protein n=1 Tax=Rhizobium/Agrobacterium group TaxID=227290 RepID=UPI001AE43351|nr:hypothetical protein [Neorhizobium galegae]MBP2550455.1 hypothetical protein [Neorhizobium galegae]
MSHVDHPVSFRPRLETAGVSAGRQRLLRHLNGALVIAAFIFVSAGILGLFN